MYQKSVDVVEWFVSVIVFELQKKKKFKLIRYYS